MKEHIYLSSFVVGSGTDPDTLSGIMKLGIKREKIGDILVRKNGADIVILNEVSHFLLTNLSELTRSFTRAISKPSRTASLGSNTPTIIPS